MAISDKEGLVKLNIPEDYIGSSSLLPLKSLDTFKHDKMYLKSQEEVVAKATSLDAYCDKNKIKKLDLIKMDIEGFEETAYNGMRGIIKTSPEVTLFVEFTPSAYKDPKRFYELMLEDFGNVYTINAEGDIVRATSSNYRLVISDVEDWVMPIFSKRPDLAGKGRG